MRSIIICLKTDDNLGRRGKIRHLCFEGEERRKLIFDRITISRIRQIKGSKTRRWSTRKQPRRRKARRRTRKDETCERESSKAKKIFRVLSDKEKKKRETLDGKARRAARCTSLCIVLFPLVPSLSHVYSYRSPPDSLPSSIVLRVLPNIKGFAWLSPAYTIK